ncbi:MAG: type II toxin-antitoxin system HipA family toxin [Nocardiopsaceae bacterium]|nr:type II toxin-antitoxin system HipA family toxin [Nocardiopsaceae bacterium]
MTDSLAVIVGRRIAGSLTRLPGGKLRFDYDDQYAQEPDATPLSLSMPLNQPSHPDQVITPWLWGLLPDDPSVLARWTRHFDLSRAAPYTLLATQVGLDCPGAVRFVPPERVDQAVSDEGQITWLTTGDVAQLLRDLGRDSTNWLGAGFTGQFSLAGAQAKTALLCQGGRWGMPTGAMPTTHILKPAILGLAGHDLNEHLCLDAARRAGLHTVSSRIVRFEDQTAVVVERYDRYRLTIGYGRIHQEDLCQALAVPPTKKYQNEGGPGPGHVADLFRRVMPSRIAEQAVGAFADALIWNWLIGGTDAHAKNYSLLLRGEQARLAPLYDIASGLPYGDHEKKLRLAMKVGGDYQLNPYRNRWPDAARDLGIPAIKLVDRARVLAQTVGDAFADAAKEPDVTALASHLPGKLTDIIASRARRCAQLLG